MIDEHQMLQVFLNILTNTEQAIHKANGKGRIWVSKVSPVDDFKITIKDDGPGILFDVLNRIFEPFFTTKELGKERAWYSVSATGSLSSTAERFGPRVLKDKVLHST